MRPELPEIAQLLARADTQRASGRGAEAARSFNMAASVARGAGDLDAWARAALGAASVQAFDTEPGRLPSLLHEILGRTTDQATRSHLAAALARCWVYAGQSERGARFSALALRYARGIGDVVVLADALDAALATHWGPDEVEDRRVLAQELDSVAAHVTDPDVRLQAHLWGLHVACEALDRQAMNRQMRALERLGEESPRAMFFAASRRLMLDLLRGRTETMPQLISFAAEATKSVLIPDAEIVLKAMDAYSALIEGDQARLARGAQAAEEFALTEGSVVVSAEAAFLWAKAGQHDKARALSRTFSVRILDELPRDVNWLLIMQCILEVALALRDRELIERLRDHLAPYSGRAVMNAGAVMFHGTTDDTLARAYAALGQHEQAQRHRTSALAAYERIGAQWWHQRLVRDYPGATIPLAPGARRPHLHPTAGGLWVIGEDRIAVAGLRGFGYLTELVRSPGKSMPVLDLTAGGRPAVSEAGLGDVTDRQALAAYHHRLVELDVELEEAQDWVDPGRIEVLRSEREVLLEEVGRATGLGGRARSSGSSQERARVAVRKAITAAIDRIAGIDNPLALHLRNSVHTGFLCSYDPDPGVTVHWILTDHTEDPGTSWKTPPSEGNREQDRRLN